MSDKQHLMNAIRFAVECWNRGWSLDLIMSNMVAEIEPALGFDVALTARSSIRPAFEALGRGKRVTYKGLEEEVGRQFRARINRG